MKLLINYSDKTQKCYRLFGWKYFTIWILKDGVGWYQDKLRIDFYSKLFGYFVLYRKKNIKNML